MPVKYVYVLHPCPFDSLIEKKNTRLKKHSETLIKIQFLIPKDIMIPVNLLTYKASSYFSLLISLMTL